MTSFYSQKPLNSKNKKYPIVWNTLTRPFITVNLHSYRPPEYKRSIYYTQQIVRSLRPERRKSFTARSSLADFGSESTSEEESEVGQQRFGRVALYSKL